MSVLSVNLSSSTSRNHKNLFWPVNAPGAPEREKKKKLSKETCSQPRPPRIQIGKAQLNPVIFQNCKTNKENLLSKQESAYKTLEIRLPRSSNDGTIRETAK